MHKESEQKNPGISDPSYQDKDINIPVILVSIFVLLGVVVLTAVGAAWLIHHYQADEVAWTKADTPFFVERTVPPAPQLQAQPLAELEEHRAYEERMTTSYEWIDETRGDVRIPVERAKELLLERGFESRGQ